MRPFHLSIGTREIEEELKFFQSLGALVTYRDESGYINIELFGSQITLKASEYVFKSAYVIDEGTKMERIKMYFKSTFINTIILIEIT